MAAVTLTVNALYKTEMEYHGKFGHTLDQIQHISIMIRIVICYTVYCMVKKTVTPTLPGLQGLKHCIQYLDSQSHKTIFLSF